VLIYVFVELFAMLFIPLQHHQLVSSTQSSSPSSHSNIPLVKLDQLEQALSHLVHRAHTDRVDRSALHRRAHWAFITFRFAAWAAVAAPPPSSWAAIAAAAAAAAALPHLLRRRALQADNELRGQDELDFLDDDELLQLCKLLELDYELDEKLDDEGELEEVDDDELLLQQPVIFQAIVGVVVHLVIDKQFIIILLVV